MLTLDALREYGADPDTGVKRCAGKEDLYLKLVEKLRKDEDFSTLREAIEEKDLEAFERIYQKILANLGEESL